MGRFSLLSLVMLVSLGHAFGFENGFVAIDPDSGIVKGTLTGLNYDSFGKFLYDDQGVVEADVSFNELLFDCTPDGTAGQICADPVTGTYGYHDYGTDYYIADALRIESLSAWFEPMSGKWLDETYTQLPLENVSTHLSGMHASLLKPWKVFQGEATEMIAAITTAHAARKRASLGEPTVDIEKVHAAAGYIPPDLVTGDPPTFVSIPSEIPAGGIAGRLENYCKVVPFKPFDGQSSYEELPALKDLLAGMFGRRTALANRVNERLQRVAQLEGRSFRPRVYPRSAIESKVLNMLDSMDYWYVLYQGNLDSLQGIALLAFRDEPTGVQLDWWPIELHQLHDGSSLGAGGFGVTPLTVSGSLDPSTLLQLVYSAECKGE